MKKLFCFALAILISATTLISCNIPPNQPNAPNDTAPSNPPIGDDEYDDVIVGGDPGETNPPADNPPEDNPPVDNPPVDNPPEDNPPVDNPPVDNPPVDNPPATDAPESSQVASGFVAKQKKYDYGENNIIILNVTNKNEKNYSVTINGFYLDADGKVIKSETQNVEGYAAGYEKYFLFNPDAAFDSFVFTLTVAEYSGECYEQNFRETYTGLCEGNWGTDNPNDPEFDFSKPYPTIGLRSKYVYTATTPILVEQYYVLVDTYGNIYGIFTRAQLGLDKPIENETMRCTVRVAHKQEDLWPEELKGSVTCIIVNKVSIWESWPDWPE